MIDPFNDGRLFRGCGVLLALWCTRQGAIRKKAFVLSQTCADVMQAEGCSGFGGKGLFGWLIGTVGHGDDVCFGGYVC